MPLLRDSGEIVLHELEESRVSEYLAWRRVVHIG